jgi:hypothetical protein
MKGYKTPNLEVGVYRNKTKCIYGIPKSFLKGLRDPFRSGLNLNLTLQQKI